MWGQQKQFILAGMLVLIMIMILLTKCIVLMKRMHEEHELSAQVAAFKHHQKQFRREFRKRPQSQMSQRDDFLDVLNMAENQELIIKRWHVANAKLFSADAQEVELSVLGTYLQQTLFLSEWLSHVNHLYIQSIEWKQQSTKQLTLTLHYLWLPRHGDQGLPAITIKPSELINPFEMRKLKTAFSINDFQFAGAITNEAHVYGLLKRVDGSMAMVKTGQSVGDGQAAVLSIHKDHLVLVLSKNKKLVSIW